jgi:hypothetical protein
VIADEHNQQPVLTHAVLHAPCFAIDAWQSKVDNRLSKITHWGLQRDHD